MDKKGKKLTDYIELLEKELTELLAKNLIGLKLSPIAVEVAISTIKKYFENFK